MESLEDYFNRFSNECEEWDYEKHGWNIPCSERDEAYESFRLFICDPVKYQLDGFTFVSKEYDPFEPDSWGTTELTHTATFIFKDKVYKVRLNQNSWDDLGHAYVEIKNIGEVK